MTCGQDASKTALKKYERSMQRAMALVEGGAKYRAAAKKNRVAKSTLWDRVQRSRTPHMNTPQTRLSPEEEHRIVLLVLKYANMGIPMNWHHLSEAAATIIASLPANRRSKLRFRDGFPGFKWTKSFYARHKRMLSFAVPCIQE